MLMHMKTLNIFQRLSALCVCSCPYGKLHHFRFESLTKQDCIHKLGCKIKQAKKQRLALQK